MQGKDGDPMKPSLQPKSLPKPPAADRTKPPKSKAPMSSKMRGSSRGR